MFGALKEPLEVQVLNDGPELLAPLLIAGAAVFAAIFAGYWQWRQLQHDRDLRREQLSHDREIHREQLDHDREMRRRENADRVLDEVIDNEARLRDGYDEFFDAVESAEEQRSELEAASDSMDSGDVEEQMDALRAHLLEEKSKLHMLLAEAHGDSIKLLIRVEDKDLIDAYRAIPESVRERLDALNTDEWPVRTAEEKMADKAMDEKMTLVQTTFLNACAEWHTPL
jgi:hypothetical protein